MSSREVGKDPGVGGSIGWQVDAPVRDGSYQDYPLTDTPQTAHTRLMGRPGVKLILNDLP